MVPLMQPEMAQRTHLMYCSFMIVTVAFGQFWVPVMPARAALAIISFLTLVSEEVHLDIILNLVLYSSI